MIRRERNADMKNIDIKKLLEAHAGDVVVVNNRWKCKFSGYMFNGWSKSKNSPSYYIDIYVDVVEDNTLLNGCISIFKDEALTDKYYGFLYLKKPMSEKWEKMFNIKNI